MNNVFLSRILVGLLFSISTVQAGTFDDLPDEIHTLIVSKVNPKDLASLSRVSQRYNVIANDESVWAMQIPSVLRGYASTLKKRDIESDKVFSYKKFYKQQLVEDPIFYVVKDHVKKAGFKANFIYIHGNINVMPTRNFYTQTKLEIGQREAEIINEEGDEIHLLRKNDFPAGVPHGIAVSGYSCLNAASIATDDIQKLNIFHIDGYTGKSFVRHASESFQSLQKDCVPPSAQFVLTFEQTENARNYNVTIYQGYLHQ